jgi:hypothetical protein
MIKYMEAEYICSRCGAFCSRKYCEDCSAFLKMHKYRRVSLKNKLKECWDKSVA